MKSDYLKFIDNLTLLLNKAYDRATEKYGIDPSYYPIKIIFTELSEDFSKQTETVLIDTNDYNYCIFCQTQTFYYDKTRDMHLCARCFREIEKK